VWSFAVAHPPLLPGFSELAPYTVAVVELDDDPRVRFAGGLAERVGDPPGLIDPASVQIGEPVAAAFHRVDGVGYLQWIRGR